METVTRVIERQESRTGKDKPVVIKWRDAKLLRHHSINIAIDNIFESTKAKPFVKINLIGASGTGKTTLGRVISHGLHSRDPSFEVHFFEDEDLIDFRSTIENLSSNNQILVFDDLSGLVAKHGKKKLDILKAEITEIRHINESKKDRKIVMILNFHAQKMLDKQLRIANYTFYTDCTLEERNYLEEILGKQAAFKIDQFIKLKAFAEQYHKFHFPLKRKNFFTYKDADPFKVILYNNTIRTNFLVFPKLSWILGDKPCHICDPASKTVESKENLDNFIEDFSKKFGVSTSKRAVVQILERQGKRVLPKRVLQAEKYIDQYLAEKRINLDELADKYNLSENRTKLPSVKQPDFEVKA